MTIKRESILERLKELDTVLEELRRHRDLDDEALRTNLTQRWIIERGIIAASALLFDVSDQVLAGQYGFHPRTYEESLAGLRDKEVISADLYSQIRGLGGLRNILVYQYQSIDPKQVWDNYQKGLSVFPKFSREILAWLDST